MDREALQRLVFDHARYPGVLLHLIQGAPEDLLREREAEGRWSPLEILAHLRDEETADFRARALAAVEGRPIEGTVDPERWVVERRCNEMDPGAVYLDFATERADSCRWLEGLTVEDLRRSLSHPVAGTMRAGDFIAAWRVHDLLHLKQIAQAMSVITARHLSEWRVDYAGRIPGLPERR
ncbi:MAG: DinB family protein [Candidatus Eiseniibacteriota bacterium]